MAPFLIANHDVWLDYVILASKIGNFGAIADLIVKKIPAIGYIA